MKKNSSCCWCSSRIFVFYTRAILLQGLVFLAFMNPVSNAQNRSFFSADSSYNSRRFTAVALGTGVVYAASMAGLYQLWYSDYPLRQFHAFNDNEEWLQMDKAGHVGSAYYVGRMGISLFNWTGMKRRKAIWYGGMLGAFFQTSIEIFDGISPTWGFSWGDVAANTLGSALLISQELAWNEQRVQFKYSFHQTKYARLRPDLLGNSLVENMFKDYNGQTYWLSLNIASFLPSGSRFPKWLGIAAGYGAEGMTDDLLISPYYPYKRYRQIYLAPDIDLYRIKSKSKMLKTVLYAFGFIKFPLPALEIGVPGKTRFLPIAF